MEEQGPIELSAIVVTPDGSAEVARTLDALAAQTARDRMEVVLVAPSPVPEDATELSGFAARKVVVAREATLGRAIARGVAAAGGPIVAYAEEHSQPSPRWAEVLIERHRGPWSAVGWAVENANPGTTASWAHLLTDFGPGVTPVESGERHEPMPWHHVSYKREDLVRYGDRMSEMVEAEGLLQADLLARGGRLFMEGGVTSSHLNISRLRWNLRSHYLGGRSFGAARAEHGAWGPVRRLAYTAGFPLVPLIRLRRLWPDVVRTGPSRGQTRGLVGSLLLYLFVDALGEAVGYATGSGPSRAQRMPMELKRTDFLRRGDSAPAPIVSSGTGR